MIKWIKTWMDKKPRRLKLKDWAKLEDVRRKIDSEAEWGRWQSIPYLIIDSIKICTKDKVDYSKVFWMDTIEIYNKSIQTNSPTKPLPILSAKEKGKPLPWEYDGRTWYFWLNLFAAHYGWDGDRVEVLDIDDAIALYQEIVIDEQMSQEWEWGLSDVSQEYIPSLKKSKFRALPRPSWMLPIASSLKKPEKTVKILKSMLPTGNIVELG